MSRTLLIVDDEASILNSLARLFQVDGYRLLTAQSGEEALSLLENDEVQVILSDQRMPGMSGVEFLTKAKDRYPDTVRMVLSGYSDITAMTEAINQGHIYKFLFKPWDNDTLRNDIREAFDYFEHEQKGNQFSKIFENSVEGIVITDENALILAVNPAFSTITGYSPAEVLGKTPALLKSGKHDAAFYQAMWAALSEEGKWSGEIWNKRKSGDIILEWLTITSVRDAHGHPRQYTGMFSDITEYKRREEVLNYRNAYQEAIADVFEASRDDEPPANWTESAAD
ncbi:MAG: PAS domain S-box protein [Sulfuricella sp.]|nr:PAS domain S-box protein [Sulfuricella sp.]